MLKKVGGGGLVICVFVLRCIFISISCNFVPFSTFVSVFDKAFLLCISNIMYKSELYLRQLTSFAILNMCCAEQGAIFIRAFPVLLEERGGAVLFQFLLVGGREK